MADIFDLTDTWNNGATAFDAVKMNVTDAASAAASNLVTLQVGGVNRFRVRKNGAVLLGSTGASIDFGVLHANHFIVSTDGSSFNFAVGSGGPSSSVYNFGAFAGGTTDGNIRRIAAGIIGVRGTGVAGGALNFAEQTAPAAPAADQVTIYAKDVGGKTALFARFNTGAEQQIAIEP
jgi:hypothetical protein